MGIQIGEHDTQSQKLIKAMLSIPLPAAFTGAALMAAVDMEPLRGALVVIPCIIVYGATISKTVDLAERGIQTTASDSVSGVDDAESPETTPRHCPNCGGPVTVNEIRDEEIDRVLSRSWHCARCNGEDDSFSDPDE